ncbi:MAG: hypothetical protein N2491_07365 [Negativicutes bacterium]|nr:hypothetical protein [Negativicutes bacterium]
MEELLKQIITRLDKMDERMVNFETSVNTRFDQVEARLGGIETRLDNVEARLGKVEERVENIDEQTKENNTFIQTLLHRTKEINALLHHIGHTVSNLSGEVSNLKDQQGIICEDIAFLVRKTGEHESIIWKLRKAE